MRETTEDNRNQSIKALLATLLVVLVLILFVSREMQQVRSFIRESGWLGLLVSVGLYGLLGASPIPSEPLTVLISTIFGPFTAMLVAAFGNLFAALIEFYIGMKIGDVASFHKKKENLPLGIGKLPVNSPTFLIFARMLPGYGPKFVSILGGVYRVPLWRYIWTTLISTLIGAAIFAYGGSKLLNLW
ncbi:MAG TPA: VTT domain-containing protein [Anaerolineales bacterium]